MNRTRLSPIDILGITLGVIVILIVIGSVVVIAQGRMFDFRWSIPELRGSWANPQLSIGGPVREEKDEKVTGDFAEIEVRSIAGSIEISGTSAAGVTVHSVKTALFRNAADNVHVEIRKEGNRLVVEEKHEPRFFFPTGTISFQVAIPRGVKLIDAHSVNGSITVHDVLPGIDQSLSTISGSVSTSRARNLNASSTSGQIQFASDGALLNARTVTGSIDGDIDSLDKGGSARLSTVSGSVTLNAFPGLDAKISLHSVSGRVSCDFPVTISEQKNNRLDGKIGAGAASVDAGTISGSISINRK
jgi:DUF4097 and DUF4098 domain-containing protein YvlB